MAVIQINTFVPVQELTGIFENIDLTQEPVVEETDDGVRIVLANGTAIFVGVTIAETGITLNSLSISGSDGAPLVTVPEIGLIIDDEFNSVNLDDFTGYQVNLSDEDDVVSADEVLLGFDEITEFLPSDDVDDDFLSGGVIDFGGGTDTVIYDLPRAELTREVAEDGSLSVSSPDGEVVMRNLEVLELADGSFLYDLEATPDNLGFVYRTYDAAFARTPDAGGLRYWVGEIEAGNLTLRQIAQAFVISDEFAVRYGEDPTDEQFVEALYLNALRRTPDDAGETWWIGRFQQGDATYADMLLAFAQSDENVLRNEDNLDDGVWVA